MKLSFVLSRFLFLATAVLAGFQIVKEIPGAPLVMTINLTIGFGTLTLAGLLLLVYGIESLSNPWVAVFGTGVPLGFSAALVVQMEPGLSIHYLIFATLAFFAIVITRLRFSKKTATLTLAVVHAIAGLLMVGLPPYGCMAGLAGRPVIWFTTGGAFMGMGGLLLVFLRSDKPILKESLIYLLFPFLLIMIAIAFTLGLRGLGIVSCSG